MPDFSDIASFFDDIPTYDAYTGAYLFDAQYNTFDESSLEGSIRQKRTMSTHPDLVMPDHRAISFLDEIWLTGYGNYDGFQGEQVRKSYWMKRSVGLADILTPGQLCSGTGGFSAHLNLEFLKYTNNGIQTSEYFPFWEVFTAPMYDIPRGTFFKTGGKLLRSRGSNLDPSGLQVSQSDEMLEGCVKDITVVTGPYDVASDTVTGTPVTTKAVVFATYMLYNYAVQDHKTVQAGDLTALIPKAVAITTGSQVAHDGELWAVLEISDELDCNNAQLRKK